MHLCVLVCMCVYMCALQGAITQLKFESSRNLLEGIGVVDLKFGVKTSPKCLVFVKTNNQTKERSKDKKNNKQRK